MTIIVVPAAAAAATFHPKSRGVLLNDPTHGHLHLIPLCAAIDLLEYYPEAASGADTILAYYHAALGNMTLNVMNNNR